VELTAQMARLTRNLLPLNPNTAAGTSGGCWSTTATPRLRIEYFWASNVTGEGEIDFGIDQAAGGEEVGETGTDENDPGPRTGDKCGHSPMLPRMMPPSMTLTEISQSCSAKLATW